MSEAHRQRWEIEHQCPQCGGPVTLEETDRLFTCAFCRVRLYMIEGRFFRYCITPRTHDEADTWYVPYWSFRGMYFSCPEFEVRGRVLDANFRATRHDVFPETLGIRTQTLRLRFASPSLKGRFIHADEGFEGVLPWVEGLAAQNDSTYEGITRVHARSFIGEAVSLVYAPVYVQGRALYDGITDRPMATYGSILAERLEGSFDGHQGWRVRFTPAICPQCGWDLAGRRDSLALHCANCETLWKVIKGVLRKMEFGFSGADEPGVTYLPFWRLSARFEGIEMNSLADLVRLANLPRAVMPLMEQQPVYFWLPAFTLNPMMFLRLTRILTVMQPQLSYERRCPRADGVAIGPVTLSVYEAAEAIRPALAVTTVAKRRFFPMMKDLEVRPERAVLVYLPFKGNGPDLVQEALNVRVPGPVT